MSQLKNIPPSEAIPLWNDFSFHSTTLLPISFNPSLFQFYSQHFNWKPYYILIFENNVLTALLPLVDTGKAWVSLPHFSYGGIVFDNLSKKTISTKQINQIISEIQSQQSPQGFYRFDLAENSSSVKQSTSRVFIRSLNKLNDEQFIQSEKITSLMDVPDSVDKLSKILSSNLNRKIRKAIQLEVEVKSGKIELLDDFYHIYSRNIHQLQSLNYSKAFFKDLMATYELGEMDFFIAYHNGRPVGAALLAAYQGFYENVFFATNSASRKYYVSDFLHSEMIKYAIRKKPSEARQLYSFGRSTRSSGVHKYKSHWPVRDYPLYLYSTISDMRKQAWLLKVWGLLPYAISNPLGARLIRHIY